MSFIRWSSTRNASSAARRVVRAPGRGVLGDALLPDRLAVRRQPEGAGAPSRPGRRRPGRRAGGRVVPVAAERGGDAVRTRVALDDQHADRVVRGRDREAAVAGGAAGGRRRASASGRPAGRRRASRRSAAVGDLDPIPSSRAQPSSIRGLGDHLGDAGGGAREDVAGGAVDRDRVAGGERPVPPIVTIPSPSTTSDAPTTAGIPQPRATTAAWLTNPPVLVRIPAARLMPWTSSGEVSARTRMTPAPGVGGRDRGLRREPISPQATPGEAARPVVSAGPASERSVTVGRAGRRGSPPRGATASSRVSGKSGSSAISRAIRRAACGVRLPTRTWSIQSLPCSIVNSMSQQSR